MAAKTTFHGCYVATLTPFDDSDRLNEGAIHAHTQWLIENGIAGLCPAGTTGEFLYLTEVEKIGVIAATVAAAAGRVPVIAGVWALRELERISLTRAAQDAGAAAVFLPAPIYYPATDGAVYAWYSAVHNASTLPVFAYNIPQYAANTVSIPCLERLFADGIIQGVKDSTGSPERIAELVRKFGSNAVVFAASDGFASEGRKLGADGFISAIGNAFPSLFARLWSGDESLQPEVDRLRAALKSVGSIPALKHLLARQRFAFGHSRLPYSDLSTEQQRMLDSLSP